MPTNTPITQKNLPRPQSSPRVRFVFLLGLLFTLAACSQTASTTTPPTATTASTATTAPTATLVPAQCDSRYGSAYVTTLPDSTYSQTTVYAQVALPPQTRSYDDDASGLRVRFMCSAGTTATVSAFMAQQLPSNGWQVDATLTDCGRSVIPNYGQQQCWKNGTYLLYLGINNNADWVVAYVDPAFL